MTTINDLKGVSVEQAAFLGRVERIADNYRTLSLLEGDLDVDTGCALQVPAGRGQIAFKERGHEKGGLEAAALLVSTTVAVKIAETKYSVLSALGLRK